ncbi:MAG: ATP-binding protein [Bdellovibrionota bacterium]
MKIRVKILLFLVLVTIVGLIALGFLSYSYGKRQLVQVRGQELLALAQERKMDLLQGMSSWREKMSLLSTRFDFGHHLAHYLTTHSKEDKQAIQESLDLAIDQAKKIKQIWLCDLHHKVITSSTSSSEKPSVCVSKPVGRFSQTTLEDIWYVDSLKELRVLMVGPLYSNQEVVGSVHVIFDAQKFLDVVHNYNGLGKTGETLFARKDKDGNAQFLTPLRYNANPTLSFVIDKERKNVPIIQALLRNERFFTDEAVVDYRGVPVLAATSYVPELDWGVVAKIDRKDALAPARDLLIQNIYFGLIVFAVITLIAWQLSLALTMPIRTLIHAAQKVRKGDTGTRIKLKNKDEFYYLGETFNEMLTALEKREENFRSAMEYSSIGIALVSPEGKWLQVNPALTKMFGYSKEEFLVMDFQTITHKEDLERDIEQVQKMLRGEEKTYHIEKRYLHKNGGIIHGLLSVSLVRDVFQKPKYFISQIQDITQKKLIEREKEQLIESLSISNQQLERFAYISSHDLQEPLRAIRIFSQMLEEHLQATSKTDEEAAEYLKVIIDNAALSQNLITDILMYSRIKNTKEEYQLLNLHEIVKSVIKNLQNSYPKIQDWVTCGPLPAIKGNETQFYQLFQNLISNGLKYQKSPDQAHVHIGVKEDQDKWVFSVQDNGIGIEPKHQKKIFDIFQRLHTKEEYMGTGVGLSICKKVVEIYGGHIWVDSEKGKGTTFYFTIPKFHEEPVS